MAPRIPVVKKNVGFPVYALAWQNDDVMIASGGGGVGNFGVKNKIIAVKVVELVDEDAKTDLVVLSEHVLGSDEDAPMTLAVTSKGTIVTGINQSASVVSEKKQNKHLRILDSTPSGKITPKIAKQVFAPSVPFDTEEYQRLTRFNRFQDPNLLAVSSTSGALSILSFPSLETVYSTSVSEDISSFDFSPADNDTIAYVTSKTLHVVPFRDSKRIRAQNKKTFQELADIASSPASFPSQGTQTFRAVRFLTPTKLLCAINDRVAKRAYLGSFVLNKEKGWRQISPKPLPANVKGVTSMDITKGMVVLASTDMAIYVLSSDTFSTLFSVKEVADFAITQCVFNPSGKHIACSSVANSISVIKVEEGMEVAKGWLTYWFEDRLFLLLALLVFVIAYLRVKGVF